MAVSQHLNLWRTLLLKGAFLIMSGNAAPTADCTNIVLLQINKSVNFKPLSRKYLCELAEVHLYLSYFLQNPYFRGISWITAWNWLICWSGGARDLYSQLSVQKSERHLLAEACATDSNAGFMKNKADSHWSIREALWSKVSMGYSKNCWLGYKLTPNYVLLNFFKL